MTGIDPVLNEANRRSAGERTRQSLRSHDASIMSKIAAIASPPARSTSHAPH